MKVKLKTRCFLLRKQLYSESSLILHVFAENLGMITILAKGLRKSKDRQEVLLNSLDEYEVIITEPATPGLYTLNDLCQLSEYPTDMPLQTWVCAQAGAELLTKLLFPLDETPQFYLALKQYLTYQRKVTANPITIFWRFVVHITKLLGIPIRLNTCGDCGADLGMFGNTDQQAQTTSPVFDSGRDLDFSSSADYQSQHAAKQDRSSVNLPKANSISAYRADNGQLLCSDCRLNYGTVYPLGAESIKLLQILPVIGNHINTLNISTESLEQLNHYFLYYLSCQFNQPIQLKSLDCFRPAK